MNTVPLSYRYRLMPSRKQHEALGDILETQRELYNAALQERVDCYRRTGVARTYQDQCRALTECRRALPEMQALPLSIQRGTLHRLDLSFRGFVKRLRRGDKPGFPRFRGVGRMTAFECREFDGLRLSGNRLRFKGVPGGLRVHMHRPLPAGKILAAKFRRDAKGWSVCLIVRAPVAEKRQAVGDAVGVDVGILTLAATSDGELIPNPRLARRAARLLRKRQRHAHRCLDGSRRQKKAKASVARLHAKTANARATALHQVSARLVSDYDLIAVEALRVRGLTQGFLARDVHDAGWGTLRNFLRYKAERAGVHFVEVDPRFTSQDCSQCGARVPKALSQRTHRCSCGYVEDRDVNAARVILSRAVAGPGVLNVAGCGERALRNLTSSEDATKPASVSVRASMEGCPSSARTVPLSPSATRECSRSSRN